MSEINEESFERLCILGRGSFGKVVLVRKKQTIQETNGDADPSSPPKKRRVLKGLVGRNRGGVSKKKEKLYAMKIFKKKNIKSLKLIKTERLLMIGLNNPFVINLRYSFKAKEKLFMVMDFIEGGDLSCVLACRKKFSVKEVRFIAACLIEALDYLHQKKVIHRDIKLSNILLKKSGYVVLSDFGLSTVFDKENLPKDTVGTTEYVAPEIIYNSKFPVNERKGYNFKVDYWSLGVVLYELLQGHTPFKGNSESETKKNIIEQEAEMNKKWKPELVSFLSKLLEKNSKKRFTNFLEMRKHPFFKNFNFEKLKNGKRKAPFIPSLKNVRNLKYFNLSNENLSVHSREIILSTLSIGESDLTEKSAGSTEKSIGSNDESIGGSGSNSKDSIKSSSPLPEVPSEQLVDYDVNTLKEEEFKYEAKYDTIGKEEKGRVSEEILQELRKSKIKKEKNAQKKKKKNWRL